MPSTGAHTAGLPLRQGQIRTQTNDFYRHGTVTLCAALDDLSGKVFAHTAARHTHRQWLDFLPKIDWEVPAELVIHVICDNYATRNVVRPGSFRSVAALVADILRFLEERNKNPKPYRWPADPVRLLGKIDRAWEFLLEEVYHPIYETSH